MHVDMSLFQLNVWWFYGCCGCVFVVLQHTDDKSGKEIVLDDTECPLQIFRDWPNDRGSVDAKVSMKSADLKGVDPTRTTTS